MIQNPDKDKNYNQENYDPKSVSTKPKTYDKPGENYRNGKPIQEKPCFTFDSELSDYSKKIIENCCLDISYKEKKMNYDNITIGKNNLKLSVEKFEQFKSNISYLEKEELKPNDKMMLKNLLKLFNFLKELESRIESDYQGEESLSFEINLVKKYDNNNPIINNNGIFNIEALYKFIDNKSKTTYTYKDKNILVKGTNSREQGFQYMILNINSKMKKNEYEEKNDLKNEERKEQNEGNENDKENENKPLSFLESFNINKKASEMEILEIIKIIENKCSYNAFIKELSNGYFAYIKSDNYLVVIDSEFNPIMEINEYGEKIVNICDMLPVVENNNNSSNNSINNSINNNIIISNEKEKEKDYNNSVSISTKTSSKIFKNGDGENVEEKINGKEKDIEKNINSVSTKDKSVNKGNNKKDNKKGSDIQIVLCGNKELYLTSLYLESMEQNTKRHPIPNVFGFSAIEMKKNNYVVVGKRGISYIVNLFTNGIPNENIIIKDKTAFFNSIRVNDNIIALVSNSIYPEGQDILNFINFNKKKFYQKEVTGYSFILSPNGLELISEPIKSNKYILCACKKYSNSQKNGILLVNQNFALNNTIDKEKFIDTDNFEVHCFCPILNVIDNKDNKDNNKNAQLEQTNFILVGGFDNDLREGGIRLYKIIYADKASNTDIEYLQDIPFKEKENIDGFNGPINCLTQSKKTGNIIASCYNGNIYLLTPPNINYYLKT